MSHQSNDVLEHYGVKGMKWGVRKRSKREERERAKRFNAMKNRRTISDKELDRQIERLQKEARLKDLVEKDLTPGRRMARQIMTESGQKTVRNISAGLMTIAVGAAAKKHFGDDKAAILQRGGVKKK